MSVARVVLLLVGGLVVLTLSSCSNRATDLMDDYNSGFDAGTALPDDDWRARQQRECGNLTQAQYGGDGGSGVDSADPARAYWVACLDAVLGHDRMSSHELATWLDEEDEAGEMQ